MVNTLHIGVFSAIPLNKCFLNISVGMLVLVNIPNIIFTKALV